MGTAELEKRTLELLMHFDALDFDGIKAMSTKDIQGVDELSGKWLRGLAGLDEYIRIVSGNLSDIHSELSDFHVAMHGDVGIVTCMIDQAYRYEGQSVSAKVPFTAVYVKENSDWLVALIHGVSLPAES